MSVSDSALSELSVPFLFKNLAWALSKFGVNSICLPDAVKDLLSTLLSFVLLLIACTLSVCFFKLRGSLKTYVHSVQGKRLAISDSDLPGLVSLGVMRVLAAREVLEAGEVLAAGEVLVTGEVLAAGGVLKTREILAVWGVLKSREVLAARECSFKYSIGVWGVQTLMGLLLDSL